MIADIQIHPERVKLETETLSQVPVLRLQGPNIIGALGRAVGGYSAAWTTLVFLDEDQCTALRDALLRAFPLSPQELMDRVNAGVKSETAE